VSDRGDIVELVVRFADAVNRRDIPQFESVWTPEATWVIDPPTDVSIHAPRAEIAAGFDVANKERMRSFTQLVHGTVVDLDGDTARARSYLTEVGDPVAGDAGYFNHGVYFDELVRTAEGWRFAKRHYRYLYLDTRPIAGRGAPVGGVL
jgi:ketosteroid isomerase-like protein